MIYTEGTSHEAAACLPDNEYLHYLPRFEMSKKVHEVDSIKRFVNRSKQFAFSHSGPETTPTTDGPLHLVSPLNSDMAMYCTDTSTPSPTTEQLSLATRITDREADATADV